MLWAQHSQVQSAPRKCGHRVLSAETRRWAWGQGREKRGAEWGGQRGQGPLGQSLACFLLAVTGVLGAGRRNTDRSQKVGLVASNLRKSLVCLMWADPRCPRDENAVRSYSELFKVGTSTYKAEECWWVFFFCGFAQQMYDNLYL